MKKMLLFMTILHFLISLWACRFIEEMVHTETPEVKKCSMNKDHFYLSFSTEMNHNLTEEAFSLTEDELEMEGCFTWDKTKMSFFSYKGISADKEYRVNLDNTAEDEYGNSLAKSRSWEFSTGEDTVHPKVLSILPADQSEITFIRQYISYSFSEPVNQMSFREAFDISPSLDFRLEWLEGNKSVQIHPLEDYSFAEEYSFTINTELQDEAHNHLEQEYKAEYSVCEQSSLLIESLILESSSAELTEGIITQDVEKDDSVFGRLSRSPDSDEQYGLVTIKPDISFTLDWDFEYKNFTLNFNEDLKYGNSYELFILDRQYPLFCNGSGSIPISIDSLYFCPEDGETGEQLFLNGSMGAYDSNTAYIELTLTHSPLGEIDQSTFMKAFSMESSVLSFIFKSIEIQPAASSGQSQVRINMEISDTGFPGTIRFSLDESLSDTLSNCLENDWAMTVNKY